MASVAIVGAGVLGCLAALDLAAAGQEVDLFDRQPEPMSEASFFNEGKIHLGFLYAMDPSLATARSMVEGALTFRGIIDQLTGCDVSGLLSTPFVYGLHRQSLVDADAFAHHLHTCCEYAAEVADRDGGRYVDGSRRQHARRMSTSEWSDDFDTGTFTHLFETTERAVNPRAVASAVRAAVHEAPLVDFHGSWPVDSIDRRSGGGFRLIGRDAGAPHHDADVVVNATWSDLLRLDAGQGIEPPPDWSYRYKLGNRIGIEVGPDDITSITVVLGAFGDLVNFGPEGGVFLSWYPHGRLRMTSETALPDWNGESFAAERYRAYEESREAWSAMSPAFARLDTREADVDYRGGIILASGRTDVHDPASALHSRVEVGIHQVGDYFSVNTGKYTLGPRLAVETSHRVQRHLGRAAGQ